MLKETLTSVFLSTSLTVSPIITQLNGIAENCVTDTQEVISEVTQSDISETIENTEATIEEDINDAGSPYVSITSEPARYSASQFRHRGVIYYNGFRWTWYSDRVLPGNRLNIPGRHCDENNYICDVEDYICLASSYYPKGTILNTPLGKFGKVYDYCPRNDTIDVYVHF